MTNWLKKIIEHNREVWHYTCENGHKWKSFQSPRGTYVYGERGQTKCPTCKSPVCMGKVYINGKYANMGARHLAFGKKR